MAERRPVLVPCEFCGAEGRVYVREDFYSRLTGWTPGDRDLGPCAECEGTGLALVPSQPVHLDDDYFEGGVSSPDVAKQIMAQFDAAIDAIRRA